MVGITVIAITTIHMVIVIITITIIAIAIDITRTNTIITIICFFQGLGCRV